MPKVKTALKTDGLGGTYTYDSEGHILNASGTAYTYDPLGSRIRKDGGGATEFYYFGGQLLATHVVGGAWSDYVYGGGRLIAEQSGVTTFRLGDHLDSLNQTTDSAGNPTGSFDFTPFGQLFNNTGSDLVLFTDHERDAESNSDHTLFRQLSMAQGRWFTPDPADGSYNLADPQSLNRYAYLINRPLAASDPNGLFSLGDVPAPIIPGCIVCDVIAGGIDLGEFLSRLFGGGLQAINEHYGQVVGVNDDSQGTASGSQPPSGEAAPLDDGADLYTVGPDPGSFGESLGIPTGTQFKAGGILGALGLPAPGCEFGACGGFQSSPLGSGQTATAISQYAGDALYLALLRAHGQEPVHGPYTYGRWCGEGGSGDPIDGTDASCETHDICFGGLGIDGAAYRAGRLTPGQVQGAQNCNQALCNSIGSINKDMSVPFKQAINGDLIVAYFTLAGPEGARCK